MARHWVFDIAREIPSNARIRLFHLDGTPKGNVADLTVVSFRGNDGNSHSYTFARKGNNDVLFKAGVPDRFGVHSASKVGWNDGHGHHVRQGRLTGAPEYRDDAYGSAERLGLTGKAWGPPKSALSARAAARAAREHAAQASTSATVLKLVAQQAASGQVPWSQVVLVAERLQTDVRALEGSARLLKDRAEGMARTRTTAAQARLIATAVSAGQAAVQAAAAARVASENATRLARTAAELSAKAARQAAEATTIVARRGAEAIGKAARVAAEAAVKAARVAAEATARATLATAQAAAAVAAAAASVLTGGR